MGDKTKKEIALCETDNLVGELLYYGRREDEDLERGEIETMIATGDLTVEEILARFESALREALK